MKKDEPEFPISIKKGFWFFLWIKNLLSDNKVISKGHYTTVSIWTKASLGKADTPTVLRAGTPPGKNVV